MKEKTQEEVQKEIEGKVANLKEKQEARQEVKKEKEKTLWEKLIAEFPKEAVQKSDGKTTKKGYDTSGIGYQWVCNRFNEVFGIENWSYDYKIVKETAGTYSTGTPFFDITVEVRIAIDINGKVIGGSHIGGHVAKLYADAYKGAITNALKKCASTRFGIGCQAYMGQLDEDINLPEEHAEVMKGKVNPLMLDQKEVNALFEPIRELADEAKRKDCYNQLQEYIKANHAEWSGESGSIKKEWFPDLAKFVSAITKKV